ncbi:serine/threonine protein phosphatase [Asticcacaulis sp. DW145]|uniref:metallophosphoesterase n=1 Tax=Asticcacaulis sp. DW145 TaxID=3095608 RepID=UPI003087773E|nr:serine/threonine protein phosphatase [Asticcacaulis sp. DW145]
MDLAPFPKNVHFCDPKIGPKIDRLTYAIGDIHGRFDLFKKMVHLIKADMEATQSSCRIVLLGDYIDRGREASRVLSGINALKKETWCDLVALKGNHEQLFLQFLKDAKNGPQWFRHGGSETVRSFGLIMDEPRTPESWAGLRDELARRMTRGQRRLLSDLRLSFEAGDYLFVHAGVDPWRDRSTQGEEVLLWIRNRFLRVDRACSKAVVHGHTPTEGVVNQKWRIGLDTAAHATGVLSAIRLEGLDRRIIQVRGI